MFSIFGDDLEVFYGEVGVISLTGLPSGFKLPAYLDQNKDYSVIVQEDCLLW